ncbi:MAG: glutamine--tRNA ligase/YqeY domain fusion protein [Gammaproteobacteria bacterium]|nr:glutamine--tRNA ligase/YqeY domain fusion protein [Gammaproteobacteria bacterium]
MTIETTSRPEHFLHRIIREDLESGRVPGPIVTRFPPEPNGFLHIGHAKSICLNFGLAEDFSGRCNLRFDDTNPHKENLEFVESIQADVRWLGYDWEDRLYFASDYFEQLYVFAQELIRNGDAYICDLTAEEIREHRGTLTEPGRNSPYRERSVDENMDLFARMRAGEFPDGSKVLRAKIDMASPNMNMRDPALYRIRHGVIHHQTGEAWCIYPMYDYTHPISDALEGITHSICTLEFEDHRPLYDWVIQHVSVPCRPHQYEFSRLNLAYTVMSKRKLTTLVGENLVAGWDDPRMPTIAGLRRRGYTPESIREFCSRIGVTRSDNLVEMGMLEDCIRGDLNERAHRRMGVLRPLRIVLTNYPEDGEEWLSAANHPQKPELGERKIPFCREVYIEHEDFMETASKKFKRLVLGGEVRLRYGYVIRCDEIVRDAAGEISELRCTYDPDTLGADPEGRKVRGVIHWVSARHGVETEVNLYDRLFVEESPDALEDFRQGLNPDSLQVLEGCRLEPALADVPAGEAFQFERVGYFCRDSGSADAKRPAFNRIVTLRDSWAKISAQE